LSAHDKSDEVTAEPGRLHRLLTNRDLAILLVAILLFIFFALMGRRSPPAVPAGFCFAVVPKALSSYLRKT
jgi:hypothetical protein